MKLPLTVPHYWTRYRGLGRVLMWTLFALRLVNVKQKAWPTHRTKVTGEIISAASWNAAGNDRARLGVVE